MRKPLGEEMEFFRQYNEVLFNQLEKKILDKETANQHLRRSVEEYQLQFKNISDVVFMIGTDFNILSISPSVEKLLGYKAEDFIGRPASDFRHILTPESFERAIANINRMLKGERIPVAIYAFVTKDGTLKHIEIHGSTLIRDGQIAGTISVARDVTERKQAEETLRESEARHREREERYRNIIDNMEEAYYEVDLKGNLTFFNATAATNLGYTDNVMMGMNFRQYVDEENASKVFEAYNKVFLTGESIKGLDWELISKRSGKIPIESSISLMRDEQGNPIGFRGIIRDITDRKRAEEALRESEHRYQELSIIDDLTQLYNSRHFHVQIERETERSNRYEQPLTLLMLDLDNFKVFNDTYGHIEGDQVLLRLGQVIKRCLRETDSAYRYGGEEFTIMLPMTTSEEGIVIAKRIQTELRKEAFSPVLGQEVYITVSIGLAQYKPKEEMKAFVHRVDQFMYQAKNNGRDRMFFESQRQEQFNW